MNLFRRIRMWCALLVCAYVSYAHHGICACVHNIMCLSVRAVLDGVCYHCLLLTILIPYFLPNSKRLPLMMMDGFHDYYS